MARIRVSMTELRKRLGNLVNRAAYGQERIVLLSRGEPKAAIVSIEELERLERWKSRGEGPASSGSDDADADVLAAADDLRERIRRWQESRGVAPKDAVESLELLRHELDAERSERCGDEAPGRDG